MVLQKQEFRLKHIIKGEFADVRIATNHLAFVRFIQDAYNIVEKKLLDFKLIRKLKLDFYKTRD